MAIAFKAMGFVNDQDIVQFVGNEEEVFDAMSPCIEECHRAQVFTSLQVFAQNFVVFFFLNITISCKCVLPFQHQIWYCPKTKHWSELCTHQLVYKILIRCPEYKCSIRVKKMNDFTMQPHYYLALFFCIMYNQLEVIRDLRDEISKVWFPGRLYFK